MNRRGFFAACVAVAMAPLAVKLVAPAVEEFRFTSFTMLSCSAPGYKALQS